MKETFNIIMIYTLTLCSVTAQNLLKNGDFEIGNDANLENDCFHQDFFNNNRVFFWESEYSNKKWVLGQIQLWPKDCGKTDPPANCDLCARHSPDWFNDASYYVNNTLGPIMNLGSNHIAGLSGYELLQQKLDNTLDNNTKYLIKFKLFVPSNMRNENVDQSQSKLKFFIAKSRIEYKKDYFVHDEVYYMLSCPDGYTEYKDGVFQDIKQMCVFDLNSYPKDQWIDVYCNYYHTSGSGFNWFAFDIHNDDEHCSKGYAYVDDIVFAEGCINGCSSTAGPFNITINEIHTQDNPFTVFGLKNISFLKIEIWTIPGGSPVSDIQIQNPQNRISWNGKHHIYGTELSAGTYGYRVTVSNDCGTKYYENKFNKINHSYQPTIGTPEYFNYESVSKPPLPDCCEDYIVIQNQNIVQDKTIGTSDPLLYKAEIRITAGPNVVVKAESDVVFEAGDMIVLNAGFTVEAGANFTAMIEPCIDLSNKNMMTENDNNWQYNEYSDLLETNKFEQDESFSENNFFSIHPNPFDNSFTITINHTEDSETEIYLTNTFGRKVLQIYSGQLEKGQHAIEVSDASLPPGMYFCIMQTPTQQKVLKVVKM